MSKKLSDPTIPELTAVANNARIYVLLMDEPEGSRDRYINASVLASSSNGVSGNGSGNVTSHSSTTVNNIVVYATTDGTGVKDSGISRDALSIAITKANTALQSGDLAGYADKPYVNSAANIANSVAVSIGTAGNAFATSVGAAGNTYAASVGAASNTLATGIGASSNAWTNASIAGLTSTAFAYANGTANISNSVAVSIGVSSNAWTNTALATLPAIYSSHANVTANIIAMLAYANGTANISNSVAATIGTAGNTYAASVGAASNTFAVGVGAASNAWTNSSVAGLFNLSTMNLDNINESSSNIHFKPSHLANLRNVMNGNSNVTIVLPALLANLNSVPVTENTIVYGAGTGTFGIKPLTEFVRGLFLGTNATIFRAQTASQVELVWTSYAGIGLNLNADQWVVIQGFAQSGQAVSYEISRGPGQNNELYITNKGGNSIVFVSNAAFIYHNSDKIWTEGSDGPGTGLDADTVDGIQGASLFNLTTMNLDNINESSSNIHFKPSYLADLRNAVNGNTSGGLTAAEAWAYSNSSANISNSVALTYVTAANGWSNAIVLSANGWANAVAAAANGWANALAAAANGWTNASVSGIDNTVQTINEITANTYVLVLSDKGKLVASNVIVSGANANVQIPNFGQVAYTNGTRIDVAKWGNVNTRITTANGIILNGNYHATLEFDGRYVAGGLHMQTSNVWHVYGPLNRVEVSDIRQVNASNSQASTVTIPADTQFGDLILFYDYGRNSSGVPTDTVETNFIPIVSRTWTSNTRLSMSMKIAEEGDAGTTINGFDGDSVNRHIIVVFRGNVPFSNCYPGLTNNVASTDGDPAAQWANSVPYSIVWAAYRSSGAVDPRTFSVTSNGEHRASTSEYVKWHTANTATANANIDMADEGSGNFLFSGSIICL